MVGRGNIPGRINSNTQGIINRNTQVWPSIEDLNANKLQKKIQKIKEDTPYRTTTEKLIGKNVLEATQQKMDKKNINLSNHNLENLKKKQVAIGEKEKKRIKQEMKYPILEKP